MPYGVECESFGHCSIRSEVPEDEKEQQIRWRQNKRDDRQPHYSRKVSYFRAHVCIVTSMVVTCYVCVFFLK
jgi:hypothetical protein